MLCLCLPTFEKFELQARYCPHQNGPLPSSGSGKKEGEREGKVGAEVTGMGPTEKGRSFRPRVGPVNSLAGLRVAEGAP